MKLFYISLALDLCWMIIKSLQHFAACTNCRAAGWARNLIYRAWFVAIELIWIFPMSAQFRLIFLSPLRFSPSSSTSRKFVQLRVYSNSKGRNICITSSIDCMMICDFLSLFACRRGRKSRLRGDLPDSSNDCCSIHVTDYMYQSCNESFIIQGSKINCRTRNVEFNKYADKSHNFSFSAA